MSDLSGKWIIAILCYYIFFFILVIGFMNTQLSISASNDYNVSTTNPGFNTKPVLLSDQQQGAGGICTGEANVYIASYNGGAFGTYLYQDIIPCKKLQFDRTQDSLLFAEQCDGIVGCESYNETSWWSGALINSATNITNCRGYVNMSYYNLTSYNRYTLCNSSRFLYSKETCLLFKCDWLNITTFRMQSTYSNTCIGFFDCAGSYITTIFSKIGEFFNTIVWMMTFQADVGLGSWNWLFTLIFFYIPLVMLLYAIATIWK